MSRGLSGWQVRSQRKHEPEMPESPAAFDMLLYRLGITEKEAASNAAARAWIREHSTQHFVPEILLKQMGLDVE
jgi:hypothetical protein